tara:strand:- start:2132 stop:2509 length:378 start_codon:yes stop_codon:yes gene_type:complete
MILKPNNNKTNKLLSSPFFFMGPIIIWFVVMLMNPSGLLDFLNSGSHPDGFFAGIAKGMGTDAGITAMWAHMVAGDICVTRWIWKDGIRKNTNIWILRISLFFGVMLMPLGVGIHLLFRNKFIRK